MVLTVDTSETHHTKYDLYLIDHFAKMADPIFENNEYASIYAGKALELAKEYPFLMHAMIALAACHLQHIGVDARCFRLPEAFHCQLASQGLRNAVSSINGVKEADSVLTTAMLLNCLTFCAADYRDEDQSVANAPRWNWLRIQIGITGLLTRTRPFHPKSVWLPLFQASERLQITDDPENDLDERLAKFCSIGPESTSENNPYLDFFKLLAPLVTRAPSIDNVHLYINAVRAISPSFIDLLEAQDTRALMLFTHWAALMGVIGSWWSKRRIRGACAAVCDILKNKLDEADIVLLELPIRSCRRL